MRTIDQALLDNLMAEAAASPRQRTVYNLHEYHETVQRMVNAVMPGSYITPHKHENPDKVEMIVALIGRVACVQFDAAGEIQEVHLADAAGLVRAVDIAPRTYHTMVALTPCAMLEIIQGPYDAATHKKFADFAPHEGQPGTAEYWQVLNARIQPFLG